ncbi:MAG TPA: MarR family transcriptional regulator [Kofleriaceae bacterium]|jgi:DNA-binding MarR family transcriptional regulator
MQSNGAGAAEALVALRRIIRFLRLGDRDTERAYGLSSAQLFALLAIDDSPAMSLAELAARTMTDPSSVSAVVARLTRVGYIARVASTTDKRRAELTLTPAGKRLVRKAPRTPQAQLIAAIDGLPPARRARLVAGLVDIVEAIGAEEMEPRLIFEPEPARSGSAAKRGKRSPA